MKEVIVYLKFVFLKNFQEKSIASLHTNLEAMKGSAQSLNEELGSDLLSQLSVEDQREVDYLNDQIKTLTTQNKEAFQERIRVSLLSHTLSLFSSYHLTFTFPSFLSARIHISSLFFLVLILCLMAYQSLWII